MIIGIDGNQWYISDGGCLGDPRSKFGFGKTISKAYEEYQAAIGRVSNNIFYLPDWAVKMSHMTVDEYKRIRLG